MANRCWKNVKITFLKAVMNSQADFMLVMYNSLNVEGIIFTIS